MKKYLIICSLLFFTFLGNAQNEIDSTRFKMGKNTIILINSAPDSLDYDYDFNNGEGSCKKDKPKNQGTQLVFDLGVNGYLTSKNHLQLPSDNSLMDLNYARSRAFGIGILSDVVPLIKERLYLSTGIGFTWNGYHFENNVNISTSNDYTLFTEDTLTNNSKYKLRVTYLEVPFILRSQFGNLKHPFGVQVGLIAGLRVGSIIKQKYSIDGSDHKNRIADNYNLSPFKLDYIIRLTFSNVGFYGRYSVTTLFEKDKSLAVYPFSVGVTVGGFL